MRLDGGQKKTYHKKTKVGKNAHEIWVGTMTEASSQSYLAIQKNKRKLENKNAVGSET